MTTNKDGYYKTYYQAHKEQYKVYAQRAYAKRKAQKAEEKKRELNKAYYEANKERFRMYAKKAYWKKRRIEKYSGSFLGRLRLKIRWWIKI